MAFPSVTGSATSAETAATNSHTIALPSGIVSGELLWIVAIFDDSSSSPGTPSGWTLVSVPGIGGRQSRVWRRIADGSEGSSVVVSTAVGHDGVSAHLSVRVRDHGSSTSAPEAGTSSGSTGDPDPPSKTSTGGAQDYLWLEFFLSEFTFGTAASPYSSTNYTAIARKEVSGTGSGSNGSVGAAYRQRTIATENPGIMTAFGANNGDWAAMTVAIYPGSEGVPTVGSSDPMGMMGFFGI